MTELKFGHTIKAGHRLCTLYTFLLIMKQSEFKRWLQEHGARFKNGRKHIKVYLNGKQSTLPRHPGHEIGESLRRAILKQLGQQDEC